MGRLGPRHLDARRRLLPASYLEHPGDFGLRADARLVVPDGGDALSRRIAAVQHLLICAWNETGRRPSAAELSEAWSVSNQTISRCALGERWLGETLLVAFLEVAAGPPPSHRRAHTTSTRHGASRSPAPRPS